MKRTIERVRAAAILAVTSLLFVAGNAWAVENPVTGETETYVNTFTGSGSPAEWNAAGNWDTGNTPFISGNYDASLVDGATVSTSTQIDGWTLRVGAYNDAHVTWSSGIKKIQAGSAGCWLTADESSSITIASFAGNQLEGSDSAPFKLTSANAGGITWSAGITSASNTSLPFWYYLKGDGTVVYGGDITVANAQVIKQADITLSGTSQVASKTLVTFGSGTTKTFTAAADIKVKDGSTVLETVGVTSIRQSGNNIVGTTSELTTSDAVGSCEIVQCTDGIVLYWVDGDPTALTPTVYNPSININFTKDSSSGLTTAADVGLGEYAVPGTSWNNLTGTNGSLADLNAVDSTGATSATGASVTISEARGSYYCSSLPAASDLRNGYIDESASGTTPTVTVSNVPYEKYKVIVYTATDANTKTFGYLTINGTDYTYDNGELTEGTTAWGNSGGQNTAQPIAEGVNVLVSPELRGSTLTVVGHRNGDGTRGCIAAIQIVEVPYEVGDNDLEIALSGDRTYTVEETKELSGTVYLTGHGTLTLAGEGSITAGTIDVGADVVLNVNAARLNGTTFVGAGVVVYDGVVPPTGKGWTDSENWTGTVWLKNKSGITGNNNATTGVQPNSLGNTKSKVKFSGVSGWLEAPIEYNPEIVLENASYDYALQLTNGNSPNEQNEANKNRATTIKKLSGSGILCCGGISYAVPTLKVYDASGFTGSINTVNASGDGYTGLAVLFCNDGASLPSTLVDMFINSGLKRTVYVASGKEVTLASGATWTAQTGFVVNGTLNANGTLASSHATKAVSGSGTVVFTNKVPAPSGDAWWKNSDWDGTVQVKDVTNMVGDSRAGVWLKFNDYGNSDSVVELNNVTGWLEPAYNCTVPLKISGTLTLNNGASGKNNAFKVGKLLGSGTIAGSSNAPYMVFQITDDWSEFTGAVQLSESKVVAFGSEIPSTVADSNNDAGTIYIAEGAEVEIKSSSNWWASGVGFVVDGTLKAESRDKWGDDTAMAIGDTGVLEFVSTSNTDDQNTEMGNITGTGTLKFSSTAGWRAYPKTDANMPATTLTIQTEVADSLILPTKNNGETVIGNLAGSKNLRSDWSANGENGRILTVTQSKNTEWQGKFVANRLTQFNVVAPAEGTPGTLTLSGTQSLSTYDVKTIPMQVDGSVNLTGTWVGNTTVSGTFGGTGTVTGNLTFSDGATFKANATRAMTVSGTVTLPTGEGETLTIDATGLDADEVTILSSSSITTETDVSKVTVANGLYNVTPVAGALKLVSSKVEITVPAIANTTVTVSVGGETIGTASGTYKVVPDAVVTVTYAAASGYEISGTTVYTIDVANSETTFDPTGTTQVAQYVAQIVGGASYTSLQAALNSLTAGGLAKTIVLLANTEDGATVPSIANLTFRFYAGEFSCGTIADATGDFVTTKTDEEIEIDEVEVTAKKYRVSAAVAVVTIPNEGSVNYGAFDTAYTAFVNGPVGTTMRVIGDNPFSTDISCTAYDSETQTYTKLAAVASITTGVMTVEYPSLSAAVAAAEAGQTVALLDNITLTATVAIDKTLTLDLNGHAITASGVNAITTSGALTIQGSSDSISVTSGASVVLTDRAATLTLSGVTLSPAPTTSVGGGAKAMLIDGTYKVVYGTIFSVY